MIFSNILLGFVLLFFGYRLFLAVKEKRQKQGQIHLISRKTGQVYKLNMEEMADFVSKEVLSDFRNTAKTMFKCIADAFAAGRLSEIKNYVTENVLKAFREAVQLRDEQRQKAEFVLIGFKEVKIIEDSENKKVVSFTTEQVNLLRDSNNNIIDGDPLYVATVTEHWTFRKKDENKWLLSAIENKEGHFA